MSITFYDFPSSPILIIGALSIKVEIAIFLSYQKYFNSPLNRELAEEEKKAFIKERKELNKRLIKIEQDFKNL